MKTIITATIAISVTLFFSIAASAQSCPPNSSAVSSGGGQVRCQCNSGYVMQGGQCVRA